MSIYVVEAMCGQIRGWLHISPKITICELHGLDGTVVYTVHDFPFKQASTSPSKFEATNYTERKLCVAGPVSAGDLSSKNGMGIRMEPFNQDGATF